MTNTGKIALLPRAIRDQINHRLLNQEPAEAIVKWLHTLSDVWRIIRQQFNNQLITPQDLSEWRITGYAEWKLQQPYATGTPNPELTADGQLNTSSRRTVDHLSEVVAGCLAQFMHHWNGDVTPEVNAKLRVLSHLTRDICALRKCEHQAARIRIEEAKLALRQKQADNEMEAKYMQLLDQPGIREQVLAHYANPPTPDAGPETPNPLLRSSESDLIKPNQGLPSTRPPSRRTVNEDRSTCIHPTPGEAPAGSIAPNQTKSRQPAAVTR